MAAQPLTIPGFTATIAVNEADFIEAIRDDADAYDKGTKLAAVATMRNGLRLMWVRDNGSRGDLSRIIKASKRSERTLYYQLAAAERFAVQAGLLERKTQKLTNGKTIAPIMETQLEFFADPKAKFEGAMKKLVKWVGERGLMDIYQQKTKLTATKTSKLPQHTDEAPRIKTVQDLHAEAEEELTSVLNALDAWFLAEHHTRVKAATRTQAEAILEGAIAKMRAVK